jgi:hypothetical protein
MQNYKQICINMHICDFDDPVNNMEERGEGDLND